MIGSNKLNEEDNSVRKHRSGCITINSINVMDLQKLEKSSGRKTKISGVNKPKNKKKKTDI